jgi:hypothetical protein
MVDVKDDTLDAPRASRRRMRAPRSAQALSSDARVTLCIAALGAAVALPALILGGALPAAALAGDAGSADTARETAQQAIVVAETEAAPDRLFELGGLKLRGERAATRPGGFEHRLRVGQCRHR